VEFNYEDGLDGRPLEPVVLRLDPDTFFRNDQQLDFALVAVSSCSTGSTQPSHGPWDDLIRERRRRIDVVAASRSNVRVKLTSLRATRKHALQVQEVRLASYPML